ncbi:MAG: hypothetical protein K2G25_01945 [Oscillospiraceae bacterium]|nr:hypothetical protein [Oscillospiraceae bacterium]
MLDFVRTVIRYHMDQIAYEIPIFLMMLVAGITIALIKKKMHKTQNFTRYVCQDMALFCLVQIAGNILLLLFQGGIYFLEISVFFLLISLLLLRNVEFPWTSMLIGLVIPLLIISISKLINLEFFVIYAFLRLCSVLVNICLLSDLILYLLSKKLNKQTEPRHAWRQAILMVICFVVLIMPSNFNFVNASGYAYGDVFRAIFQENLGNTSDQDLHNSDIYETVPEHTNTTTADFLGDLIIQKSQVLSENVDYVQAYQPEIILDYKSDQVNCHEFCTTYLNEKNYQNTILNSMIDLTKTYQINPTYLFSTILQYSSQKSRQIPVENSITGNFNFDMDFDAWDASTLTPDAYTAGIYNELMKNFSMIPDNVTDFPLSHDASPFYSYFAFCDENAVYYVTLYLTLDAQNQIIETDYTLLELIDLNQESEEITLKNYAGELQAIYDTAFGAAYSKTSGIYDMILEQGTNQVYVRKYYSNYAK